MGSQGWKRSPKFRVHSSGLRLHLAQLKHGMVFIAWPLWEALPRWRSQGLPEKSRDCSSDSFLSLEDLSQVDGSDPDPTTQMLASTSQLPSHWRAGAQFGCQSANISCSKCAWTCRSCLWMQPSPLASSDLSFSPWSCVMHQVSAWSPVAALNVPEDLHRTPQFPFSALSTPISSCFPVAHDIERKTSFVHVQVLRNR